MKYDIILNDIVGYYPVTGRYVQETLAEYKGKPVNVFISSLGGSLQDGLLIRQAFLDHGDVTAHIFGFTASAATIMALGAKKVVMADSAMYMVHCCSTGVWQYGSMNAEQIESAIRDMETKKDFLGKTDGVMAYLYAKKCGKSAEDCFSAMQKETWMTAAEAKEFGLVDEISNDEDVPDSKLDASSKARISACGLPLPPGYASDPPKEEKSMLNAVMQGLKSFFSHAENDSTKGKKIVMDKKTFPLLLACLVLDEVTASADGSVTLTADQLKAIESHLKEVTDQTAALQSEKVQLSATISDLESKIKALGKEDGDDTHQAGLDETAPEMSVQARYEALQGIL